MRLDAGRPCGAAREVADLPRRVRQRRQDVALPRGCLRPSQAPGILTSTDEPFLLTDSGQGPARCASLACMAPNPAEDEQPQPQPAPAPPVPQPTPPPRLPIKLPHKPDRIIKKEDRPIEKRKKS